MNRGRLAACVVVALAIAATVVSLVGSGGAPDIRESVRSAGLWAPLLFLVLHTAVTITPLPRTVFTIVAGALFGSLAGLLLSVAATCLSAVAAFWLVRLVGRPLVERYVHRAGVTWLRARLERRGLLAVLSLRLIAVLPFAVVNYASGLSGLRFMPYLIGTVIGVVPGTVAIVVLGDAAAGGEPSVALLAVSVVLGLLGVVGAVLAMRRPELVGAPERAL